MTTELTSMEAFVPCDGLAAYLAKSFNEPGWHSSPSHGIGMLRVQPTDQKDRCIAVIIFPRPKANFISYFVNGWKQIGIVHDS